MNDESTAWIDDALGALAATDAGLSPPACVETAVLREWDQQQARQSRRRPVRRWFVWALVPAAAGVFFGVAWIPPGPSATSEPVEAPVELAACAAAAPDPPRASATKTASRRLQRVRPPFRIAPGADAGYVIVPDPLVDPTTLRVVRVRMSRMALATLGMPLVNPDADSLVEVEILVGDEGVAQSIRRAVLVSEPAKD